jgi:predicted methyltransferase
MEWKRKNQHHILSFFLSGENMSGKTLSQAISDAIRYSKEYSEMSVVIERPAGGYWSYLYSDYDGKDGKIVYYYMNGERMERRPS